MREEPYDFRALMELVLAGDQDAAKELLDRFGPAVLKAVRKRLGRHLRSKFDSLDFAQDVWGSFFAAPPPDAALTDQGRFVARLTRIAENKVVDACRRRPEAKRGLAKRELSLDHSAAEAAANLLGDEASPSQVFLERDEWERLLKDQPLVYRRVLDLLREGRSVDEVATELDIHPRRVYRLISKVASRLRS